MDSSKPASIGRSGQPWGAEEKREWLALQRRQRSYADDVVSRLERVPSALETVRYGELAYPSGRAPLFAVRSREWRAERPCVLVTGGVHGYETSGVLGALAFIEEGSLAFLDRVNLVVAPCVSPWAYEHVQRWNPEAVDPNRSFRPGSPVQESAALMALVAPFAERVLLHVDLHETTDSDESEFRPMKAARDGERSEPGVIPDGFYVVGDTENPQLGLQAAVISAVSRVTHVAEADSHGEIIGSPVVAPGVILYALRALGLCAGMTSARFTTTTEVYPDSPRASAAQCNAAQVTAIRAAISFALASSS